MEDLSSEPVKVFVRLRPEVEEKLSDSGNTTSLQTPLPTKGPARCVFQLDDKTVRISPPDGASGSRKTVTAVDDKKFMFDRIFSESCTQEDVYQSVSSLVKATVRGYNTTIFAYGSTGSGKSYTMTGNSIAPGIIPRAISEIFSIIENTAAQENDVYFYVRLSYVELYNNSFRNLLEFASKEYGSTKDSKGGNDESVSDNHKSNDSRHARPTSPSSMHPSLNIGGHRADKIEVRESQSAGVFLAGPNLRIPVTSAESAFQLIAKGNKIRAVGSTQCNDVSSRSHAILTLHVESRYNSGGAASSTMTAHSASSAGELRLGKMHLVDLAGSERLAMSGAEGETLLETQNINLSLTAIGDVLSALSRNAKILAQSPYLTQTSAHAKTLGFNPPPSSTSSSTPLKHSASTSWLPSASPNSLLVPVPYRNSKLTHLLKDSLGGNSKTIMITTIRSTAEYYQQTAISLMYASRAKKVCNRSLVNRNIIGDTGIHAVTSEIERLRSRLEERTVEFESIRKLQVHEAQENHALKARLAELKAANDSEKKMLEVQMKQVIHSQAGQLASQRQKISMLEQSLQEELAVSQNLIAEQEREIIWLKKALDDTAKMAHQPVEQVERMQRVLESWQTQAKTTQRELVGVLDQVEELKATRSELESRLTASTRASSIQHKAMEEEVKSLQESIARVTKEKEMLAKNHSLLSEDSKKLKALYDKSAENIDTAGKAAQELAARLKLAEAQLVVATEDSQRAKSETAALRTRLSDSDHERDELKMRLGTVVSALEQKTAATIASATQRLAEKEAALSSISEIMRRLEEDLRQAKAQSAIHKEEAETAIAKFAEAKASLERGRLEFEATKDKFMESEASRKQAEETADQLKSRLKNFEAELTAKAASFADELRTRAEEVHEMRALHRREVARLREENSLQLQATSERLRQGHEKAKVEAVDHVIKEKTAVVNHLQREVDSLKEELQSKTADFKNTLSGAHAEVYKRVSEELQEKYDQDLAAVQSQASSRVSEAVKKAELDAQLHSNREITEYQSKFDAKIEALKSERDREVADLNDQHNAAMVSLSARLEEQSARSLEALRTEMLEEKERELQTVRSHLLQIVNETEISHATEIEKEKEVLQQQLQLLHHQQLSELASQHQVAVADAMELRTRELDAKHQTRLAEFAEAENRRRDELLQSQEKLLRDELSAALLKQKHDIEEEHMLVLDAARATAAADLAKARIEYEHNVEAFKSKVSTLSIELDGVLESERILRDLKCELEATVSSLEQALETVKAENDEQFAALREEHAASLKTSESQFQQRLSAAMEALEKAAHERLTALADAHAEEKAVWEKLQNETTVRWEDEQSKLLAAIVASRTENETAASQLQELREQAEKDKADWEERHFNELASLRLRMLDERSKEIERERQQLLEQHSSSADHIRQVLLQERDASMQAVEARNAQLQDKLASLVNELKSTERQLVEQRADHKALQTTWRETEAVLRADIADLSRSLTEVRVDLTNALAALNQEKARAAEEEARFEEVESRLNAAISDSEIRIEIITKDLSEKEITLVSLNEQLDRGAQEKKEADAKIAALEDQEARLLESHRLECVRLGNEFAAQRASLQFEISAAAEAHRSELSSLRKALETTHGEVTMALRSQLQQLQDSFHESLKSASLTRQEKETKRQAEQEQEFDRILKAALAEREAYHKQAVQSLKEAFELETTRLTESRESDRIKLENEWLTRLAAAEEEKNVLDISWNLKLTTERADMEAQSREHLSMKIDELSARHKREMANAVAAEKEAAEKRLHAFFEEMERGKASQENAALALAKQRVEFETEKIELLEKHRMDQLAWESKHREQIKSLESAHSEREGKLKATFADELKVKLQSVTEGHEVAITTVLDRLKIRSSELDLAHKEHLERISKQASDDVSRFCAREAELQRLLDECRSKMSTLEVAHEKALVDHEIVLQARLTEAHATHTQQLETASSVFENEMSLLKDEHAAALYAMQNQSRNLEHEFSNQIEELHSKIRSLTSDHECLEVELKALQSERDRLSKALGDTYAQNDDARREILELTAREVEAVRRIESIEQRCSDVNARAAEEMASKDREHALALQAIHAESIAQLKEASDAHALELAALQSRREELHREYVAAEARIKELEETLEVKELEMKGRVEAVQAEARLQIAALEGGLSDIFSSYVPAISSSSASVETAALDEVEEGVEGVAVASSSASLLLTSQSASPIAALRRRMEKHVGREREEKAELEARLIEACELLQQQQLEVVQLTTERDELVASHDAKIVALEDRYLSDKKKLENSLRDTEQQLNEAEMVQTRLLSESNEVVAAYEAKMQAMESECALNLQQRQEVHEAAAAQWTTERRQLDDIKAQLEVLILDAEKAYARDEERWREDLAVSAVKLTQLTEKLSNAEDHIHSLESQKESQLENLSESLQRERDARAREEAEKRALQSDVHALQLEFAKMQANLDIHHKRSLAMQADLEHERKRQQSANERERQLFSDLAEARERSTAAQKKAVVDAEQLQQVQSELAALRSSLPLEIEAAVLAERERLDQRMERVLAAREKAHAEDLRAAVEDKQDRMQNGYLSLLQSQVDRVLDMIQRNKENDSNSLPKLEDMHKTFLSMVRELPSVWEANLSKRLSAELPQVATAAAQVQRLPLRDSILSRTNEAEEEGGEKNADFPVGDGDERDIGFAVDDVGGPLSERNSTSASATCLPVRRPQRPKSTPIYILANAYNSEQGGRVELFEKMEQAREEQRIRAAQFGFGARDRGKADRARLPWSSPTLRSSPVDQLIAAILDGDVTGLKTVIRSKGGDLRSPFWESVCQSTLPLHRAISGLHFHGSEKLLISTLDTLCSFGADVNAADHAGNSVLYKALQVCTSKSVVAVVAALLRCGADPRGRSKGGKGETLVFSECRRCRSASPAVISQLVCAGADPNALSPVLGSSSSYSAAAHSSSLSQLAEDSSADGDGDVIQMSPLTLMLLRGSACATETLDNNSNPNSLFANEAKLETTPRGLRTTGEEGGVQIMRIDYDEYAVLDEGDEEVLESLEGSVLAPLPRTPAAHRQKVASAAATCGAMGQLALFEGVRSVTPGVIRCWLRVLEALIKSGATWDLKWRERSSGATQLHLLCNAFPPPKDEIRLYRAVLKGALRAGFTAADTNKEGTSVLHAILQRFAHVSFDDFPDSNKILKNLLDSAGDTISIVTLARSHSVLHIEPLSSAADSCLEHASHILKAAALLPPAHDTSTAAKGGDFRSQNHLLSSSSSVTKKGKTSVGMKTAVDKAVRAVSFKEEENQQPM